ncbi:MAG: hypothetical protein R3B13_12190 [Polyangiaceae bacterium]
MTGVGAGALAAAGVLLLGGCGSSEEPPTTHRSEALITDLCDQLASLPCHPVADMSGCAAGYLAELDVALAVKCEPAFEAWLDCLVSMGVSCSENNGPTAAACLEAATTYRVCMLGERGCVGGGTSGAGESTCNATCGDIGASCTGAEPGPVTCSCASGQTPAKQFQAPQCPPSDNLVLTECGPALP